MSDDPKVVVRVAPGACGPDGRPLRFVVTSRRFAVAAPGDRYNGGLVTFGTGEPMPTTVTVTRSEWIATLGRDDELREHVEAGRLTVERA